MALFLDRLSGPRLKTALSSMMSEIMVTISLADVPQTREQIIVP